MFNAYLIVDFTLKLNSVSLNVLQRRKKLFGSISFTNLILKFNFR